MKLIRGKLYKTPQGVMTYCGIVNVGVTFECEICHKERAAPHEFCANWDKYQQGYVGEWYHYGSECIKKINIIEP